MKTLLALALALLTTADPDPAKLLKQTGFPLSEAIAKATPLAKEGTVVSAELKQKDGKVVYSIEFAQGDKTLEIKIDAKSGELTEKEIEDKNQSVAVKALKTTLLQAIENALKQVPGQAFDAEAEMVDEKLEIKVKILSEGKEHKVRLDPSGVVVKDKTKKKKD